CVAVVSVLIGGPMLTRMHAALGVPHPGHRASRAVAARDRRGLRDLRARSRAHQRGGRCSVRGTPLEAGAKALVVRAEDRFVHCVLPAHLKADNARLRALVGTRTLRFATPDELRT